MKSTFRKTLVVAPFLLAAAILLAGLLSYAPNPPDEGDNMLGALCVARGGDIYKAYFSQHPPFPYYFTSLFALIGVDSVIGFRIAFSGALLIFWLVLYWAYAGIVKKQVLLFFIAAYPLLAPFCLGHLIMAEAFTAQAMVVLLIEYLRYLQVRTLSLSRMIVISLCVFVAVMSCIVSIYAVFFILLGFGMGELRGLSRAAFKGRFRQWGLFLLVLAIPFGLLLAWYAATGNLRNFYEMAYLLNRTVYSRFIGGLGASAGAPFLSMPPAWLLHIWTVMTDGVARGVMTLSLLLAVTNSVFLIGMLFRRQFLAALIIFLFLAAAGIRGYGGSGYTGFHSMPYYVVSLLVFGVVLSWLERPKLWAWVGSLGMLAIFLALTIPTYAGAAQFRIAPLRRCSLFPTPYDRYIQTYAGESKMIWFAGLNGYLFIDNHVIPASRVYGMPPWVAGQYADMIVADLIRNRPNLILFDPEWQIWGYRMSDYGGKIINFIQARYQPLDKSDPVKRAIYLLK
ncbi:MAG: hypothetical protein PHW60_13485 [Kiritimatiellae bacterium]|nr:hypothetical protein [Kiritimatiellia bacterium]